MSVTVSGRTTTKLSKWRLGRLLNAKATFHPSGRVTIATWLQPVRQEEQDTRGAKLFGAGAPGDLLDTCPETRPGAEMPTGWRDLPMKTRFTGHLRNQVVDASALIERSKEGKTYFFTLTIPGSGEDVSRVTSAASGYMVERLNRWLRPKLSAGRFLYVWEVQKRGTAHLHYLAQVRGKIHRRRFIAALRKEWRGILLDVSESSGVNLFMEPRGKDWSRDTRFPVLDVRSLRGGIARYLGKYCSKSKSKSGGSSGWYPGRWGAVSYRLQRELRRARDVHSWAGELEESPAQLMGKIAATIRANGFTVWRLGDEIEQIWDVLSARPPTGKWDELVFCVKALFEQLNERNIPNGQRTLIFPGWGAVATKQPAPRRKRGMAQVHALSRRI